jgi:hypothetical protein
MPPKGQKRKRTSTHDSSPSVRKKSKSKQLSHPESASSDDSQYAVRIILDERKVGKRTQYLLDWEPHPATGQRWDPSWAPSTDVGDLLIKEWSDRKSNARPQQKSQQSLEPQDQTTPHLASEATNRQKASLQGRTRRGRGRRVINSSPRDESISPSPHQPRSLIIQETPGSPTFSAESSPPSGPTATAGPEFAEDRAIAKVHVTQQNDFDREEYQIGLTQQLPPRPSSSTGAGAEPSAVPPRFGFQTVIPDSQSLPTGTSLDTIRPRTQTPSGSPQIHLASSDHEVSISIPVAPVNHVYKVLIGLRTSLSCQ